MKKFSTLFLATFLAVFFTSCRTTTLLLRETYTDPLVLPIEELCPQQILWEKIDVDDIPSGTFQITQHIVKSTNSHWKCIKVDLDVTELEIIAEPSKENLGKRFYIKQFANKTNSITAINTVPFDLDGRTYIPVSIVKIKGEEICPPNNSYAVLGLSKINGKFRAFIQSSQSAEDIEKFDYAFGGFFTILDDSTIFEFEKYKRSRSAVGISNDGRFLYLFAGCGINCPTGRNGFNFEECALILQKLGCTKAMEFDGGHSTGLTLKNKDAVKPSLQRKVPAAFGIIINKSE